MKIIKAFFLKEIFKSFTEENKELIRQYLYDENIVEIEINSHTKVCITNFLSNLKTYNRLSDEQAN